MEEKEDRREMLEKRALLQKLKSSENFYQQLLENAPIPVAFFDTDASVMFVNPAFEKRVGYSKSELVGRTPPYPWWIHPERRIDFEKELKQGARKRELLFRDRDNRKFWVESNLFSVKKEGGAKLYIAKWLDITERKRIEKNLQRKQREIERSEKRLKAFSQKLLSVREDEKQKLAQSLHNEIGTMVIGLGSRASLIRDKIEKRNFSEALAESDRLISMISEYGSRLRKLAVDLHPPDLFENGLPRTLKKHFSCINGQSNIKIDFNVDMTCESLDYDTAVVIYRIAQEAINNVVKHARANKAEVTLMNRENSVMLSVIDDGVGFNQGAAFDRSLNTLGIASMREMAESLNGDFYIMSDLEKGTSIKTTIPLSGGVEL